MKKTIMILVDSFSRSYLSHKNTPFLYEMAGDGFSGHIEPMFAFRGIESTIFSGVWPETHGIWTEFSYNINNSYNKLTRAQKLLRVENAIPYDRLRYALRYIIKKYFIKNSFYITSNLIPAKALRYFELSQRKRIFEENALGEIITLFDLMRKEGVSFKYIDPPFIRSDKDIIRKTTQMLKTNNGYDFLYLKLSDLDSIGHTYGPKSSEIKKTLKNTDLNIQYLVTYIKRINKNAKFIILSDHGMSEVNKKINLFNILAELKTKLYKDYIIFIDSTIARFWFKKQHVKGEIEDALTKINYGHILSEQEKRILKLPFNRKYGELIYVLDEGCIFHPDFFHRSHICKGMHGYAYTKTFEGIPLFIIDKNMSQYLDFKKLAYYIDVFPLILRSLNINLI